jgi:hypothetical protein
MNDERRINAEGELGTVKNLICVTGRLIKI